LDVILLTKTVVTNTKWLLDMTLFRNLVIDSLEDIFDVIVDGFVTDWWARDFETVQRKAIGQLLLKFTFVAGNEDFILKGESISLSYNWKK
jgi:hypothetical protein